MDDKIITIKLKDGYTFEAKLNGNNYYPQTDVDSEELTDENCSEMYFDDSKMINMYCSNDFTDSEGRHLIFLQYTDEQLTQNEILANQDTIVEALAELIGN